MKAIFGSGLDKSKTFKPKRAHRVGTKRFELHKYAQATLGTGNLHEAVTLPEGEDANEWPAVDTVDFFNEINLLYGVIAEVCTEHARVPPSPFFSHAPGSAARRPRSVLARSAAGAPAHAPRSDALALSACSPLLVARRPAR